MKYKQIFVEACILVAAATLVGIGANFLRPESRKVAWTSGFLSAESRPRSTEPPPDTLHPSTDAGKPAGSDILSLAPPKDPGLVFLEISGDVALRLHQAGALCIDARRSGAYEQGHIRNALNIPVWEHDAEIRIAAIAGGGIRHDAVIMVYCAGGECEDAALLAAKLAQAGYYNIYLYKDGFAAWANNGWPVAEGKEP